MKKETFYSSFYFDIFLPSLWKLHAASLALFLGQFGWTLSCELIHTRPTILKTKIINEEQLKALHT